MQSHFQRAAVRCERGDGMYAEWAYEGDRTATSSINGSRSRYPAERMVVRVKWMQFASKWVAPQEYRLVPWKEFHEIGRFLLTVRRARDVGFSMAQAGKLENNLNAINYNCHCYKRRKVQ